MPLDILVTGAAGFIGRHVARAAGRAGNIVRGLGHGTWSRAEWREWGLADWHAADVTVDTLVSFAGEPDLIVHCAGSGSVAFSMAHPAQDFDRSVATMREVLEYARLHRPGARVVLPSSASVYGNVSALPIPVGAPLWPASPYGVHKRIAENLCQSYAAHFGVPTAIVRLFSVYGVGLRKQLLWDACTKLEHKIAEFGGTGDETRDWLHADDAATLLLVAGAAASPSCPIVNGATGTGVPTRQIIGALASGFDDATFHFSGLSRPGDPPHFVAEMNEAHAMGWRPERRLDEELQRYVRWYCAGAQ